MRPSLALVIVMGCLFMLPTSSSTLVAGPADDGGVGASPAAEGAANDDGGWDVGGAGGREGKGARRFGGGKPGERFGEKFGNLANLSPECRQKIEALRKEFVERSKVLRQEMQQKRRALMAEMKQKRQAIVQECRPKKDGGAPGSGASSPASQPPQIQGGTPAGTIPASPAPAAGPAK